MLVICDFDGTITTADVTNVLWDRFGIADWRARLLPGFRSGELSHLELMDIGWREVTATENELLAYARPLIDLRAGFQAFVDRCRREHWTFHVLSGGLDWYLRALLPPDIPFTCYITHFDGGWRVRLPAGLEVPDRLDFKVHALGMLRARHPGLETVFIGDGRNDLPVAREADRRFAVRGSTLARLCDQEHLSYETFDSFDDVAAALLPDTRPVTAP